MVSKNPAGDLKMKIYNESGLGTLMSHFRETIVG